MVQERPQRCLTAAASGTGTSPASCARSLACAAHQWSLDELSLDIYYLFPKLLVPDGDSHSVYVPLCLTMQVFQ